MYRIRFHGRGGQGIKTAARILGNSFFAAGFQVQDAPRYGAERRGAPIFAYVRADKKIINERGVIHSPDIAVVADDTLLTVARDSVIEGLDEKSTLLVITQKTPDEINSLLQIKSAIIAIPSNLLSDDNSAQEQHDLSIICSSAAAVLTGEITLKHLEDAINHEFKSFTNGELKENINAAGTAYNKLAEYKGKSRELQDSENNQIKKADWIDYGINKENYSAPIIIKPKNSSASLTGTWRVLRPVINTTKCSRCLMCYISCPDSAINLSEDKYPEIDYQHCKGCLVCAEVCPLKIIISEPEHKNGERG